MTVQDVGQFARLGLKPIIFVLNNDGYLIERLLCKDPAIEYNDIARWNYSKLPAAFGCDDWQTFRVTTCGELDDALAAAASATTGVYIEVVTDAYAASPLSLKPRRHAGALQGLTEEKIMQSLTQILSHTPAWVYVLLVYLVSRGVKAFKPAEVAPLKLAIVPTLLTGWGLSDLIRLYGVSAASLLPWLGALSMGAVVGWFLIRGGLIEVDRVKGVIRRPADYTVLPLILIAFSVKYAFGVMAAIAPDRLAEPSFRMLDLTLSGAFAGIFVGKFAHYLTCYLNKADIASGPGPTSTLPAQDRRL
jgi:hypothetical protein